MDAGAGSRAGSEGAASVGVRDGAPVVLVGPVASGLADSAGAGVPGTGSGDGIGVSEDDGSVDGAHDEVGSGEGSGDAFAPGDSEADG